MINITNKSYKTHYNALILWGLYFKKNKKINDFSSKCIKILNLD